LLLHHDDAEREFAYDREFRLSPLVEALDKADAYGITVVSMKDAWKTVFPSASATAADGRTPSGSNRRDR
jgi:peptide subunit release factor 1 (eRF1)